MRGLRERRFRRQMAGPRIVRAFGEVHADPFFVEVGSNDGEQHDHLHAMIHERSWRGLMVEPVPYVFRRLERNYGALDRVALENAAVADRDGTLPFFHLIEASEADHAMLPDWYDALGSFSREVIANHRDQIPDIEERIVEIEVPCLTFESLCREHGIAEIDLLVIDTEGYDHEILKGIDFERFRPRLVIYEHFHLRPADRGASRERLHLAGYESLEEGFDTFCLRTAVNDELTRIWRDTSPAIAAVSAHEQ